MAHIVITPPKGVDRSTGLALPGEAGLLTARVATTTRSVIDSIAVASSGVWVVKHLRRTGIVMQRNGRLSIGGADCTRVVERLDWQVAAVANALEDEGEPEAPIHAALVVDGARWPLHSGPLCVGSTWVLWPEALEAHIAEEGSLDALDIRRIHAILDLALPPADHAGT